MIINVGIWFNILELDYRFQAAIGNYIKLLKDPRAAEKVAKVGGMKETHKANLNIDFLGAEPSEYLHFGYAKAEVLNDYFAHQFKEKLTKIDDTNPLRKRMKSQGFTNEASTLF